MNKAMHRDWGELAGFYNEVARRIPDLQEALDALAGLCVSISKSHLKDGLFAHTSMSDLLISQTKTDYPPPPMVQWLIMRPQPRGIVEFTLRNGLKGSEKDWDRTVSSREVLRSFNKFLRQLGWNYHSIPE